MKGFKSRKLLNSLHLKFSLFGIVKGVDGNMEFPFTS